MGIRIPSSDFHQFTEADDHSTELVVENRDQLMSISVGTTKLLLSKDQAQQLSECLSDWLADRPNREWSDFWTMAMK